MKARCLDVGEPASALRVRESRTCLEIPAIILFQEARQDDEETGAFGSCDYLLLRYDEHPEDVGALPRIGAGPRFHLGDPLTRRLPKGLQVGIEGHPLVGRCR